MTSSTHHHHQAESATSRSTKRTWRVTCSMPKSYLDQPRLQSVRTFAAINLEAGS